MTGRKTKQMRATKRKEAKQVFDAYPFSFDKMNATGKVNSCLSIVMPFDFYKGTQGTGISIQFSGVSFSMQFEVRKNK